MSTANSRFTASSPSSRCRSAAAQSARTGSAAATVAAGSTTRLASSGTDAPLPPTGTDCSSSHWATSRLLQTDDATASLLCVTGGVPVPDAMEQAADRLLKGIVPDELLTSYVRLLAEDGCEDGDAVELLGGPEPVEALRRAEMAHLQPEGPALPPRLVPAPPEIALQGVLATLARRVIGDQEKLLDGQRRLAAAPPLLGSKGGRRADRLVRILTETEEISDTSRALIATARRDWLTLENYVMERPLEELAGMPPPASFEGNVRSRSIYAASCLESPVGARMVEINVEAGEEARIVPHVGMKMKIADEALALLPLTPTGLSGALLIRSSVVVTALREYFELLWERATPIGTAKRETPLPEEHMEILELLGLGLSDSAIGRRMDLSVATVGRRVGDIRQALGAESRFAIGAAAVRRGWIP